MILCECGIASANRYTRNTLDCGSIAAFRYQLSGLPIAVDASHARISSMQLFRLHGGTALAVDATTPAASNGSATVASICLAVIANPPSGGLLGASSGTITTNRPPKGRWLNRPP